MVGGGEEGKPSTNMLDKGKVQGRGGHIEQKKKKKNIDPIYTG
jgi:hypothetical protein